MTSLVSQKGISDVNVRHIDDIKGYGVFASKNIPSGSVIFEEKPLVCCQLSWNQAYGYESCENCLRPLETAEENARRLTSKSDIILPYPECCITDKNSIVLCNSCGIKYCSKECQATAFDQYHRTLCEASQFGTFLFQLNETWKKIHYPPETSTIMIIPKILATIIQKPDREDAILNFCHRSTNQDAELAHKLLGEKFAGQISHLHELLVKAVPNKGVEHLLTPDAFHMLLALIGTNGQGVGTSPISQWVSKSSELQLPEAEKLALDQFIDKLYEDMDAHAGNFLNNEGVALYSLQSKCNHSCIPNAEPTYLHNNSTLSLVALKDISEGEEILISYLDECSLNRSRHSRQKELKENYLFVCTCEKCLKQCCDPDVTSDENITSDEDEQMSE